MLVVELVLLEAELFVEGGGVGGAGGGLYSRAFLSAQIRAGEC